MLTKVFSLIDFFIKKINLFVIVFCSLSFFYWMMLLNNFYYFRGSGGIDQALHQQTIWSLSHGSIYNSIIGAPFLAEHCTFISFIIAFFYKFFPDPFLIQYIKLFAFFAGVYIFFLILKKKVHAVIAFLAVIAFSLAPANLSMLRSNFNYEPLAIPFIFLIFKAFEDKNYVTYIISCIFLTLIKEQMPLVVMMFGVYAFLFRKEEKIKWAFVPFFFGLAMFILEVFIIIPYFRQGLPIQESIYWSRFAGFGKTPTEIFLFLATHPYRIVEQCLLPQNKIWLRDLFNWWGWLSFLNPQILLVGFPLFLKNLLSSSMYEKFVFTNYYAAIFMPFIFLATWCSVAKLKNNLRIIVCIGLLLAMFFQSSLYIQRYASNFDIDQKVSAPAMIFHRVTNHIPASASVVAEDFFVSYVADRKEVYPFTALINGYHDISGTTFKLSPKIDYIVFYFYHPHLFMEKRLKKQRSGYLKITNLISNEWQLKEAIEDIVLYERNDPVRNPYPNQLVNRSNQPFLNENSYSKNYQGVIELNKIDFPKFFSKDSRIFPVTMYWKALDQKEAYFNVATTLLYQGKKIYSNERFVGSLIYPTISWKSGEYVQDQYFHLFPHLLPGQYSLVFAISNAKTKVKVDQIEQSFIVK